MSSDCSLSLRRSDLLLLSRETLKGDFSVFCLGKIWFYTVLIVDSISLTELFTIVFKEKLRIFVSDEKGIINEKLIFLMLDL